MINEVSDKIRGLIEKRLQIPRDDITPDASLVDLGADSIAMMDLLMDLESGFGILIPDQEAANIRTVGEATSAVEKLLQAKQPA